MDNIENNIKYILFELISIAFFNLNNFNTYKSIMENNFNKFYKKKYILQFHSFIKLLEKCYNSNNYSEFENFLKIDDNNIKNINKDNIVKFLFNLGVSQFINYYKKNYNYLYNKFIEIKNLIKKIKLKENNKNKTNNETSNNNNNNNNRNTIIDNIAKLISEIFLPELEIEENEILNKWKIEIIKNKNRELKPQDFIIQLNGLYTLSSFSNIKNRIRNYEKYLNNLNNFKNINKSESLNSSERKKIIEDYKNLIQEYKKIENNPGERIGVYDHPVEIFCEKKEHELLNFLEEFDNDISFEKTKNVFNKNYKVPVIISISTTHKNLELIVSKWVRFEIKNLNLKNLNIFILDNEVIEQLKKELFKNQNKFELFTVEGNYSNHFNALKYMQLIFEKGFNIKAGFKLDTDEGINSENLYSVTSRTWFQTLCNKSIGNIAKAGNGKKFKLSFIIGEYVNNIDIMKTGYKNALFESDVKPPSTYNNNMIFFNKGFAHAKATSIYNKFSKYKFEKNNSEFDSNSISHPVVKGGGYGIENSGLKKYTPFCPSFITRAEDQAFYYSGFSKGIRGIFIETLRITHYKEKYSHSEEKTTFDRLIEDIHRLILFSEIGKFLNNKNYLDPLPGVFISNMAFCQSFITIVYNTFLLILKNQYENGEYLLYNGVERLLYLHKFLQTNNIKNIYKKEEMHWQDFVKTVEKLDPDSVKSFLEKRFI